MSFAPRDAQPVIAAAPMLPTPHLPALAGEPPEVRFAALRQTLLRILADTALIADAVKTNGAFTLRGFGGVTDPESTPIRLRGFAEHFVVSDGGTILSAMFTTVAPDRLEQLSPAPQLLMHDLVCRARTMNLYCQQAERDEALGVALQSPGLPPKVDRILVSAAYLAGYMENLVTAGPVTVGMSGKVPASVDLVRLEDTINRHVLMATDRMLEPERIDEHLPQFGWPHLGAEILRRPETGQMMLHGVYVPALYARQLATKSLSSAGEPSPSSAADLTTTAEPAIAAVA